jgi:hypothetical protein
MDYSDLLSPCNCPRCMSPLVPPPPHAGAPRSIPHLVFPSFLHSINRGNKIRTPREFRRRLVTDAARVHEAADLLTALLRSMSVDECSGYGWCTHWGAHPLCGTGTARRAGAVPAEHYAWRWTASVLLSSESMRIFCLCYSHCPFKGAVVIWLFQAFLQSARQAASSANHRWRCCLLLTAKMDWQRQGRVDAGVRTWVRERRAASWDHAVKGTIQPTKLLFFFL